MKATVTYDDSAEPSSIKVTDNHPTGQQANFALEGSTAVLTSTIPADGESHVYVDDLSVKIEYVKSLPFVQAVTLDEYTEEQEA